MSDEKKVRAPYNFVPFHMKGDSGAGRRMEKVIIRYQNTEDLPSHDVIDLELKTGEIHVTMRAETPVFVSDGHKKKVGDKTGDDTRFFQGPNGQFMLPGSTIRGMIRENMQILGFGLVRPGEDLEDYQIYFREIAAGRGSTGGPLKEYYHSVMATETRNGQSTPKNVKAGYLRKEGDDYYIQPVKGSYIRVSHKNPALMEANLTNGEAMTVKVAYKAADGKVKSIRRCDQPIPGMEQGVLLYTGKAIKENTRYLFPAADMEAARVPISKEDRISYQEDYENRRSVLGKRVNFWALPEGREEKPVFYVRHDGHTYFGMSLFLRIGYSHKLSDGLPAPDSRINRHEESVPLDYPHAVLGFTGKEHSYRSRVSFGDFPAEGAPQECPDIQAILAQPKPSWYAGYVVDGKHYNNDDFELRGYKLYWLKNPRELTEPDAKNVASALRPLPEGTVFRGIIRYKNLHPDELGLLLWALCLEDGCFQSVGMGKPYGFGRVKLTVDRLLEYDVSALYKPDSLCKIPVSESRDSIEEYIKAYDRYACGELYRHYKKPKKTICGEGAIKDFLYMRSTIREWEGTSYMGLSEYKNIKDTLPTVREIRKNAEAEKQQAASAPPVDMDTLLEALKRKYNTNDRK